LRVIIDDKDRFFVQRLAPGSELRLFRFAHVQIHCGQIKRATGPLHPVSGKMQRVMMENPFASRYGTAQS